MSYRQLSEGARNLIIDYIKANIGAALDVVGGAVGAPQMTLENPASYFIYEKPQGYQLPAVFVMMDEMDFRIQDKQSNALNARDSVFVSAVVEDQDMETLVYKADRYASALHSVLNLTQINNDDASLCLKVVVYKLNFSQRYMAPEGAGDGGKFRKEIVLRCEVEHVENM